jgi:hypothetical protein
MKTQTADRCTSVDPAIAAERRSKQLYIPIAHVHALMVASNPQRGGSHSAVVETSQRYNTAGIGVGLTHWDGQQNTPGVVSIEPGAFWRSRAKCPSITTRLPGVA